MKRIVLVLLLITAACGKEDKISPAEAATFVRYFNGGNNDVALSILETSDEGLLILANTEIKPSELVAAHYKIKLIKTDKFGNQVWEKFYPDFTTKTGSYQGSGMILLDDGSIAIAGSDIDANGVPRMMILKTDAEGNNSKTKTFSLPVNANGVSVATNDAGDFIMVGNIPDPSVTENIITTRLTSSLDSVWSRADGDVDVTLINRLFIDNTKEGIIIGGSNISGSSSIKILNIQITGANPGGIIGNPPIGNPSYKYFGNDFFQKGDLYTFIGQTDQKTDAGGGNTTGDFDILYYEVSPNNPFIANVRTFPLEGDGAGQNEVGNSICVTKEGGLLLLGTVNSQGNFGNGGKDYYIIKLDPFGEQEWTQLYGSKFDDNGAKVIQVKDGGYVILGTTTLANLKTLMLMKTDKNGEIQ